MLLWFYLIALICSNAHANGSNSSGSKNVEVAAWHFDEFAIHITVMLFLLIMILIKIAFHRIPYLSDYVPESLVLILFGLLFGAFIRYGLENNSEVTSLWDFTPRLFFDYLLPPIVLEASYSLYNRTFGEYLGVVLLFAILGTIFNFLIIGLVMYGLMEAGAMGFLKGFDIKSMLLFSSLIVAVDPVAVLAIFQEIGVELSLYYIVFGESLLNDATTVVLYGIMEAYVDKAVVELHEIGLGIASFFTISLGGLLIGVIIGVISCLLSRIRTHLNAFILVLLAYFSYIMADTVGWSGIISMIGCGLTQAAYAFHNLDSKSLVLVHQLTKLLAEVCESVIFLYLGIEVMSSQLEWHTGFMLWSLLLCLLTRALVVFVMTAIINAVNVDNTKITITQQIILIYGGLRGAVAFSLAVLIKPNILGPDGAYSRRIIITDTLFIILFTVGFMGITMKPLVRLLKIRMQTKQKLSLFNVLNNNMIDELMAGLEIITDKKGRNVVRDWFKQMDERYIRRLLQREPETYDQKIFRVYEKIALQVHYAAMQPEKMDVLLEEIPQTLHKYALKEEHQLDLPLSVPLSPDRDVPITTSLPDVEAGAVRQREGDELADYMVSTRKVSLAPHGKRQLGFDETFRGIMKVRNRAIKNRLNQMTQQRDDPNVLVEDAFEEDTMSDSNRLQAQGRRISYWMDTATTPFDDDSDASV